MSRFLTRNRLAFDGDNRLLVTPRTVDRLEPVRVLEDDTEETLLSRMHAAEHELLAEAIQLLAEDRVRVEGRRVRILPPGDRGD